MNLKIVTVDGFQVETTEAGAQAINTLLAKLDGKDKEVQRLAASEGKVISDKDTEIADLKSKLAENEKALGAKDGEIKQLKSEAMDETKIHSLVTELASATAAARLIAPDLDYKGKSVKDMRKLAVAKIDGDTAVKDKSDDYIQGVFDKYVEMALKTRGVNSSAKDPIADFMRQGVGDTGTQNNATAAHSAMVKDKEEAWRNPFGAKH